MDVEDQQENPFFTLGVQRPPKPHRRIRIKQNKDKCLQRALQLAKSRRKKITHTNSKKQKNSSFQIPKQIFPIAPTHFYSSPLLAHLCSFLPVGMQKQEDWCKQWEKNPYPQTQAEPLPCFQNLPDAFWSPSWANRIRNELPRIYQHRWRLRRFLHRWRVSRLHKVNTEDIVTCEIPVHPIQITDWSQKQVWMFEASTLMHDITNRLQHHDGFFEQPQAPRNPLTNLPLNASQVISVWIQLAKAPIPKSHVFTAFRVSRMNLNMFRYEHRVALQMHALRTTMAEFTHYEAIERLLDFISIAYDRQNAICDFDLYDYVVRHIPNHELVQRWRALCLRYHELELRYDSFSEQKKIQQNKVLALTHSLLHKQQELIPLVPPDVLEDAEDHLIEALQALQTISIATITLQSLPL